VTLVWARTLAATTVANTTARPPSSFDNSTVRDEYRRAGIYARDFALNRRDPSGGATPVLLPKARPHYLLDDHDLVYTTRQSPAEIATLAQLPTSPAAPVCLNPRRETSSPEPVLAQSKRFELQRRGQRVGDIGWGCAVPNTLETLQNGRVDGHALVSSELHKKHQFMRLSGDPCFDKHGGRMVLTAGSLRKPDHLARKR